MAALAGARRPRLHTLATYNSHHGIANGRRDAVFIEDAKRTIIRCSKSCW